jgi:hypothetical protein
VGESAAQSDTGHHDIGHRDIGHRIAALPHAGELEQTPGEGRESVRYCVDVLKAKRIAHGVLGEEEGE